MKGFPKHINTEQDVQNCLKKWPEQTKAFLQLLLDNIDSWLLDHKLADGETGVTDSTHKIQEITDEETGEVTERYQLEWREDPNCKLYRLGLTKQEALNIINN